MLCPVLLSTGRVTPEQLSSYVQLFKNNFKALENHCGLLQLVLAAVQTLKHPQISKWDNFLAFERLLLQVHTMLIFFTSVKIVCFFWFFIVKMEKEWERA